MYQTFQFLVSFHSFATPHEWYAFRPCFSPLTSISKQLWFFFLKKCQNPDGRRHRHIRSKKEYAQREKEKRKTIKKPETFQVHILLTASSNMGPFNNHEDKKRGEGGSQMITIVHIRKGGGNRNVHEDKMFGKCSIFTEGLLIRFILLCDLGVKLSI